MFHFRKQSWNPDLDEVSGPVKDNRFWLSGGELPDLCPRFKLPNAHCEAKQAHSY